MYQIGHNIVPRTDCCRQRTIALLNKVLGIVQPHVGPVGETGNPNEVRKIFRLRIPQHLHDKFRTELRHSQAA